MKNRRTLIILFLFIVSIGLKSQSINETDSLYLTAFKNYSIQLDSFYTKFSDNPSQYKTIFLETPYFIDSIPTSIGGRDIVILTHSNWKYIYKQNRNTLIQLKIFPIEIQNGMLIIGFVPYQCKRTKRNQISQGFGSWTNVYFKYNCNSNKWEFFKVVNGGI